MIDKRVYELDYIREAASSISSSIDPARTPLSNRRRWTSVMFISSAVTHAISFNPSNVGKRLPYMR